MSHAQRKLFVFNSISLDGYFADTNGGAEWFHEQDPEWDAFVTEATQSMGPLLFGRVTYQMMELFWPTENAKKQLPKQAEGMNRRPKWVASRSLKELHWENSKLIKGDLLKEVKLLKEVPGEPICILGSGSLVTLLTDAGLIDEYQFMLHPRLLGNGRSMFAGLQRKLQLELFDLRRFSNGCVLLQYGRT
jgi:dihydrofolate reductase